MDLMDVINSWLDMSPEDRKAVEVAADNLSTSVDEDFFQAMQAEASKARATEVD